MHMGLSNFSVQNSCAEMLLKKCASNKPSRSRLHSCYFGDRNNSTYFLSIFSVTKSKLFKDYSGNTADFSLSENVNDVTPQLILINNFLFDHKNKMSGFIIAFFDQKKLLNNHFIFN